MKQKKINDILYVFDITPYQITEDTDAEVIKVQEECVAGFKELNESLANKIVAYNYHVMCVQVPEWAPYVDQDDPSQKEDPELEWSENSATVTIGADDNVFPTLTNPYSVTVTYSSSDTEKATINESTGQITLVAAGDTIISATFAGNETYEAQTVYYTLTVQSGQVVTGHTLTLDGYDIQAHVTIDFDLESQQVQYQYFNVAAGTEIEIYPTEDPSYYDLNSGATWDTDRWVATMPNSDLTISIDYEEPVSQDNYVDVTYNVVDNSQANPIFYSPSGTNNAPDAMYVDGGEVTVSNEIQFLSTGTHEVRYIFDDNHFDILLANPDGTNISNTYPTAVTVGPGITAVDGRCWAVYTWSEGVSDASPLEQTYLPTTPPEIYYTQQSDLKLPEATIYVPEESVSAYTAAEDWSDISLLIQADTI